MKIDIKQAVLYQPYKMGKDEYFIISDIEHIERMSIATILRYNRKYFSGDHREVFFYHDKKTILYQSKSINRTFIKSIFEIDPENIVEAV